MTVCEKCGKVIEKYFKVIIDGENVFRKYYKNNFHFEVWVCGDCHLKFHNMLKDWFK